MVLLFFCARSPFFSYHFYLKISASAVNGTEVFAIEVTNPDPPEAALLANTIAKVLPDKIASIVEGTSVRIVDHAVTPTEPDSPSIIKNTAIGGILGFGLRDRYCD